MEKREIYIKVIESEIAAQNLYKSLASHCKENQSNIFMSLIPLEKIHEEKMRKAFSEEFPGEELKVNEQVMTKTLRSPEEMRDPKNIYDFAIELENKAREAYQLLANSTGDTEMKQFFMLLAEEEGKHEEVLKDEIEKLANTMIWFDESELAGFMEF